MIMPRLPLTHIPQNDMIFQLGNGSAISAAVVVVGF